MEVFLIRCDGIDIPFLLIDFLAEIVSFLDTYLGLPLHFHRLQKTLIDKIVGRLPVWKGKNLAKPRRATLAKLVLIATYHLMALALPKWLLSKLNNIWCNFVWHGDDQENASGGHALVD